MAAGMFTCYVILLLATIHLGEGCTCMPRHPQTSFCAAKFVVKAKVVSEAIERTEQLAFEDYHFELRSVYYKLDIRSIFKGKDKIESLRNARKPRSYPDERYIYVHTPHNDGVCGIRLMYGEEYLLSGTIRNNQLHVNACDWRSEWDRLSGHMRNGVNGGYDCHCSVTTCFGSRFCYNRGNNHCKMQLWNLEFNSNTMRHCSCKRHGNKCAWLSKNNNSCEP